MFRVVFVKSREIFLHFIIRILTVVINHRFHDKELIIKLVINLVSSTWNLEA